MTTLTQRLDTVTAFLKAFWQVALLAGALVAVLLLVRTCNRADRAEAALKHANETAEAERLGLTVIHEVKEAVQDAKIKAMSAESAGFAAAWQAAEKKLKARPVITMQASTGPVPVVPGTNTAENGTIPGDAETPTCRLNDGDQGEIIVRDVVRQMKNGTRDVVGHAQAFRVFPRELLFEGPFEAEVTDAEGEPVPLEEGPGWGGGALAGIGTQGATGEVVVMTPPFLGSHLSAVGAVQLGAGPSGAIMAGVVWR